MVTKADCDDGRGCFEEAAVAPRLDGLVRSPASPEEPGADPHRPPSDTPWSCRWEGLVSGDRDPLSWRSRQHVIGIMGLLMDANGPVSERVLLDLFLPKTSIATTDRVLRDMVVYGAVRARRDGRSKAYEPTLLGRAWWDRRVADWPWPDEDPAEVDAIEVSE